MRLLFFSARHFLLTFLLLVCSFFISAGFFSPQIANADFLDECPGGLDDNGCCISPDITVGVDCSIPMGGTNVEICHNNGTNAPSTNSIAGNTPGAHFTRCDWVGLGDGTDIVGGTASTCEIACRNPDTGVINSDCSLYRNDDAPGHSTDTLGACSPSGCTVNGCDDGNICTDDVCNTETGECSFPTVVGTITCREAAGDCDVAEECGTGTPAGDTCPTDMFAGIGMACDDSIISSSQPCEAEVCNDMGECIVDSTGCITCETPEDCNDGNSCTQDTCNAGECENVPLPDGTICRSAAGICDEAEMCDDIGSPCPPDDFVPAEDMVVCDDDGDECTLQFCDGVGNCELIALEPGEGECPLIPPDDDVIIDTDGGDSFQLYCFYDLRDRESFCQITNIGPDMVTLHVQIFNVGDNCNENDFNDKYTPADTHVYDLRNITTNDGNPSGVDLPDDAYGFVVVTAVAGGGEEAIPGNLIGNFRVLDASGYEYRTNAMGPTMGENDLLEIDEYTFNFNQEGGVILSDVVGITLDEIFSNEAKATSIVDVYAKFDISVFNNDEVIFSCRDIVYACNDQDAPLLEELLATSGSNVASFEYGINEAIPHSKGGPLLCPGNNIGEGFVILDLIPPSGDFDIFIGYVGLNNGNGRGSMDSFWHENLFLQTLQ